MNKLKISFAGIAATVAAVSFGYLTVQYFGRHMVFAISTGMFGLGAAVHLTQRSLHQKSLPKTLVVTKSPTKLIQSQKEVKKHFDNSGDKSPATANFHSIIPASKFLNSGVNLTKFASTAQSYGYCRKRLALYHKAKVENSTKAILKD